MPRIIIPLAQGFEEIEAVSLIDILRRGKLTVTTAGLDNLMVTGSHGITLQADSLLADIRAEEYDMMVLPGGQPGTDNLKNDPRITEMLQYFFRKGLAYGAICAAPSVLAAAGVLRGRKVTSFPGYETQLGQVDYSQERVVTDGQVLTSRGAGTAGEFALEIVAYFQGQDTARQLREAMLYK